MSPYLILLIVLIINYIMPSSSLKRALNVGTILVMSMMLAFRVGQGPDWGMYCYIYESSPDTIDFNSLFYSDLYHSEIGWKIVTNLFRSFGISFFMQMLVISLFEMTMICRFIRRYSSDYCMSLLIFFPTYYLTYMFSAVREGIVIAVFLGIMFDDLVKERIIRYIIVCLICCSIHGVSIILLLLPAIRRLSNTKPMRLALAVTLVLGALSYYWVPAITLESIKYYTYDRAISWSAVLYRVLCLIILYFSLRARQRQADYTSVEIMHMRNIYLIGFCLYFLLIWYPTLATRLSILLTSIEICLIPRILTDCNIKHVFIIKMVIIALIIIMTSKNLYSYTEQGRYYQNVTWLNYPYVSIFNHDEIFRVSNGRFNYYIERNLQKPLIGKV